MKVPLSTNQEEVEQKGNKRSGLGQKGNMRIWRNEVVAYESEMGKERRCEQLHVNVEYVVVTRDN